MGCAGIAAGTGAEEKIWQNGREKQRKTVKYTERFLKNLWCRMKNPCYNKAVCESKDLSETHPLCGDAAKKENTWISLRSSPC
jgi:hypothetical protein